MSKYDRRDYLLRGIFERWVEAILESKDQKAVAIMGWYWQVYERSQR